MSGTAQYVNRWGVANTGSALNDAYNLWDFMPGSDIVKSQPLINGSGLKGTRKEDVSRSRLAPYTVGGTLTCEPSPSFFGTWLKYAMGNGTGPALADALLAFDLICDRGGSWYHYIGCVANRMVIRGSAGGMITCAIDVLGLTETVIAENDFDTAIASSLVNTLAYEPFTHADLAMTLAGSARSILDFTLTIDNGARATFANSLTAIHILPGVRTVTLEANVPFTSTEAGNLYGLTKDGAAGSLVLTNSTVSTTFTFGRVQIPDNTARTQNGEVVLPIRAQIRGVNGGAEFTVTNDTTP